MTNTVMEIGDQVRTLRDIKSAGASSVLLPRGSVGKVRDLLGQSRAGSKLSVEFEGLPFLFNFWADELKLVKKGKPSERKKPPPEPTTHPQRSINLGGVTVEVDVKLAPLIQGLFEAGILTCMSCQENQPGLAWLMFARIEYALVFVHKASKAMEFFIWKKDGFVVCPDDDFGAVSIRFPLTDLKAVTKLFPPA